MAEPSPRVTSDQVTAIANAGAGPLADLAKQAGAGFALTPEEAKNYGAGFVSDLLRMADTASGPGPEPYTAAVENIANQNPANVKVSAEAHPNFPPNTLVAFEGTGVPALDAPERPPYVVTSSNSVGNTFKIDLDLRSEPASVVTGTVTVVAASPSKTAKVRQSPPKAATILTDPPPKPEKLKPQVPNGYENEKQEKA